MEFANCNSKLLTENILNYYTDMYLLQTCIKLCYKREKQGVKYRVLDAFLTYFSSFQSSISEQITFIVNRDVERNISRA